jgi:hypothetical protein
LENIFLLDFVAVLSELGVYRAIDSAALRFCFRNHRTIVIGCRSSCYRPEDHLNAVPPFEINAYFHVDGAIILAFSGNESQ